MGQSAPLAGNPRVGRHRHCLRLSLAGSAVWLGWLAFADVGPVESLLALSPLVLHPLVLRLALLDTEEPGVLFTVVSFGQLPAGIFLVAAFTIEAGPTAAGLAAPWAVIAAITALLGVRRVLRRGLRPAWALATDAGLMFLAVGGLWTVASRLGARPLGFDDTIVLLTGVHFHYAGFVLPVLAGLTARAHRTRAFELAAWGVIAAVPLTAIGITLSPSIEMLSAVLLAACAMIVAAGQLLVARDARRDVASLLLGLSSLSLTFAMTLATVYAITEFRGAPFPAIPEMAHLHGTLNALGTCLLGVWAWTIEGPRGNP